MDILLFADHLRAMRRSRPGRGRGIDLAGAGALIGAACVVCLLVVTLQTAFSRPLGSFEESAAAAWGYEMPEDGR